MKNIMKTLILLLTAGALSVSAAKNTFTVNAVIPDDDPNGLQNTQTISGYDPILTDIAVSLKISALNPGTDYAYNGDFFATLLHESGYAVLLNRVGVTSDNAFGYSDSGLDITFTLTGSDIHAYRDQSYSTGSNGELLGNWGVDGRNVDPDSVDNTDPRTAMLDSFAGLNPNGEWTLFVADVYGGNAAGKLDSWSLDLQAVPEPSGAALIGVAAAFFWIIRRHNLRFIGRI